VQLILSHVDLRATLKAPVIIVNDEDDPSGLPSDTAVTVRNVSSLNADILANTAVTYPMLAVLAQDNLRMKTKFIPASHYTEMNMNTVSPSGAFNKSATTPMVVRNAWLVNGQYQPTFALTATEWVLFDVLVVSGSRIVELELRDAAQVNTQLDASVCDLRILALDGIYLTKTRTGPYNKHLPLLQGSRATIALMCRVPGTYYVVTASVVDDGSNKFTRAANLGSATLTPAELQQSYVRIGKPSTKSIQTLLGITVSGQSLGISWAPPPDDLSTIPRPAYLTSTVHNITTNSSSPLSNKTSVLSFQSKQLWSIGLDQRGCCAASSPKGVPYSNTLSTGTGNNILQAGQTKLNAKYWMGVGRDCTLECFDDYECRHFFGANYSVTRSPSVILNKCLYLANNRSNYNSVLSTAGSSDDGVPESPFRRVSQVNITEQVAVWSPTHHAGTLQFLLRPVQIFSCSSLGIGGNDVTVGPYRNIGSDRDADAQTKPDSVDIDNYGSTIEDVGGEYVAFYGEVGDFRDVLPIHLGRTIVHVTFDISGPSVIRSGELLQSDLGYWFASNISTASSSSGSPTESTPSASPTTAATVPSMEAVSKPFDGSSFYSMLCDVNGLSSRYIETIDTHANTRTIITNGCPSHFSVCQSAACGGPNVTLARPYITTVVVPLVPTFGATWLDNTCAVDGSDDGVGIIGVALNGVSIYAPGDGVTAKCQVGEKQLHANRAYYNGVTTCSSSSAGDGDGIVYCGDSIQAAASTTIDKCGGQVDNWGRYHYKIPPICLVQEIDSWLNSTSGPYDLSAYRYNQSHAHIKIVVDDDPATKIDITTISETTDAAPSPQIGWALDGFPIYGPFGPLGMHMKPCGSAYAHPTLCLDQCNGLMGEFVGYDHYLYRYYVSGEVATGECSSFVAGIGECDRVNHKCCASQIPSGQYWPYTVGCFRGCPYKPTTSPTRRFLHSVTQQRADCMPLRRGVSSTFVAALSVGSNLTTGRLAKLSKSHGSATITGELSETTSPSPSVLAAKQPSANKFANYSAQMKELYQRQQQARVRAQLPQAAPELSTALIRQQFNRSLAILRTQASSGGGAPDVSVQPLPDASFPNFDYQITAVVYDSDLRRIYFATPGGLFSMSETGGTTF
jgi:hypothetical protein